MGGGRREGGGVFHESWGRSMSGVLLCYSTELKRKIARREGVGTVSSPVVAAGVGSGMGDAARARELGLRVEDLEDENRRLKRQVARYTAETGSVRVEEELANFERQVGVLKRERDELRQRLGMPAVVRVVKIENWRINKNVSVVRNSRTLL